jgi:hypothetical protein
MDHAEEIKRLYYNATPQSIQRDLTRAVELLKQMAAEDRERVAVFMDGLSQMRSEWASREVGRQRSRQPRRTDAKRR